MAYAPQAFGALAHAIETLLGDQFSIINNPTEGPLTAPIKILPEDAGDLQVQITKALSETGGMLILIGMPYFENESPFNTDTNAKVHLQIMVGENPTLWRDAAGLKPNCQAVVAYVTSFLAQQRIDGMQKLRVKKASFIPNPKRQLYELDIETMITIPPAAGQVGQT